LDVDNLDWRRGWARKSGSSLSGAGGKMPDFRSKHGAELSKKTRFFVGNDAENAVFIR
jgi:hypothetical protein